MKNKFLLIILTLICTSCFGQEIITQRKTKSIIESSPDVLNVFYRIPNNDFYIATVKDIIVENVELDGCIEIDTSKELNIKLIKLLNEFSLLDELYIEIDNKYETIESRKKLNNNEVVLILDLDFFQKENYLDQVSIPLYNKKKAKKFIDEAALIFGNKYCFKKLKRKL